MRLAALLIDALRALRRRPVTVRYPLERRPPAPQQRGLLRWSPEACTGCALCVKDCPAGAIQLVTLDKAAKRFVLRYDAGRCIFCGQCVLSCRFHCLALSPVRWELAERTKDSLKYDYGQPADVAAVAGPTERAALPSG